MQTMQLSSPNGVGHEAEVGPEISVVMPCLNEARTVGACVDQAMMALRKLGIRGEVVVADNGSTDQSAEIARAHGARVVSTNRRGYGNALQAGIAGARGRFVLMGDADESYDFGELGAFVARLRKGDELVMGNRFLGGIQPGAMPWLHRWIGNPILTGILNLFFHTPIRDAHCGLRAVRKDSFLGWGVHSPGMEFASEMVIKASLHAARISEVPIVLHPDGRDRPPHLRSFRDGWRHLRLLLIMCPQWLYLLPTVLFLVGGLGLMAWLAAEPRQAGSAALDGHTLLVGALLLILGYQTLWLWAFARVFGCVSGLLPPDSWTRSVVRHVNLERGLVLGVVLCTLGVILNGWLLGEYAGLGQYSVDAPGTLRFGLWGGMAIVLGVQTIYGSFFLSMLGLTARDTAATE
jgi:glycosyltransferase involved in cell wall biosynthesis